MNGQLDRGLKEGLVQGRNVKGPKGVKLAGLGKNTQAEKRMKGTQAKMCLVQSRRQQQALEDCSEDRWDNVRSSGATDLSPRGDMHNNCFLFCSFGKDNLA